MSELEKTEKELQETQRVLELLQKKVRNVKTVGLVEALASAMSNLEDVKARITKLEQLGNGQDELTRAINKLTISIDNELVARQKMRDRESEILDKLGKYLDNWA